MKVTRLLEKVKITQKEKVSLTEGSIGKSLLFLSLPIVVINLLRLAYNIADFFWLGQFSKEALAAISFSFPVIFLMISLGIGLAVAGSVLVAQFEGSGDKKMVDFAASQTIIFSFLISIVFGLIGFFSAEHIVTLFGASEKVIPLATSYLQIIFLGWFFMFGFSIFIALMRGYGDTFTPMVVMFGSVVLNLILDPFLIFGWSVFPKLGITGAAIGTIFSRGLALLVGLFIMFSDYRGVKISLSRMVPDLDFFRRMVKIGFPASIGDTARALSANLMIAIVGGFSTAVVAGYGIGMRVFSMVFLPAIAVSRGVETMTGQNAGAKKFERAEKANYLTAKYLFGLLTVLGVIVFFFPNLFVSVFSKDPEVVSVGAEFLKYVALSFGFVGLILSFAGGFRGSGKTFIAAFIRVLPMAFIMFPFAFFASGIMGVTGVWLSFPVSHVIGGIIAVMLFRTGRWKHEVVGKFNQSGEVAEEVDEIEETIQHS